MSRGAAADGIAPGPAGAHGSRVPAPASLCRMAGQDIDIDPGRVAEWLAEDPELQVIDVRQRDEHEAGHIEGTRLVELATLTDQADSIERGRPVVFYCRAGGRSTMAAQALRAAGFEAFSMAGGMLRWAQEGRPLSPDGGHVADH